MGFSIGSLDWRFQVVHDLIEFCATFGYERDSRRSEWAYAACGDAAAGLHRLLGGDYVEIAAALAGIHPRLHRSTRQQPTVSPSEANALSPSLSHGRA
jgi:hypothetical protein